MNERASDWNVPDGSSYEPWYDERSFMHDEDPIIWKDLETGKWYIDNVYIPPEDYGEYNIVDSEQTCYNPETSSFGGF